MADLDRGTDHNPVVTELLARGETGTDAGRGVDDWTGSDLGAAERARDRAPCAVHEAYDRARERASPPANHSGARDRA
jgi:hypothetical protein